MMLVAIASTTPIRPTATPPPPITHDCSTMASPTSVAPMNMRMTATQELLFALWCVTSATVVLTSPVAGLPRRTPCSLPAGTRGTRATAWPRGWAPIVPVSYTHLRAHETPEHLVCRLLLE